MLNFISRRCPRCGHFKGWRKLNWKQIGKRLLICCGLIVASMLLFAPLTMFNMFLGVLDGLFFVGLVIVTPFYTVGVGKNDKYIHYQCNTCKYKWKEKNWKNKEIQESYQK
ncbi:hypothetical protein KCL49_001131 [Clostridium perfringens]|nr:hypothetical protein [Clostridium perfringens]